MSEKKHKQLGMNAGTASHKLLKDLLFKFISEAGYICHRCKKPMSRESFSIEHIEPWLDSEDPVKLFFDLSNIAFSHKRCNIAAARRPNKLYHTIEERKVSKRRLNAESMRRNYSTEKRRQKHSNTGY